MQFEDGEDQACLRDADAQNPFDRVVGFVGDAKFEIGIDLAQFELLLLQSVAGCRL